MLILCFSIPAFSQSIADGVKSYETRDFEKAKALFKSVSSKSDSYSTAQYYLGRIAFDLNEYDEAVDFFDEAIETDETNAIYYTWLANAYGRLAQNSNKIRQGFIAPKIKSNYEKAIELDPKNMEALWGLVEYYTQAPAMMGGSWDKAEATADQMKKVDMAEGYRAYVTIYLRKSELELADQTFVKLAEYDPRYEMSLGTFYQNYALYDKAFQVFEKIYLSDSTNLGALYQIGKTSALSGLNSERGIEALKAYLQSPVIEGNPSHAGAKFRIGMIYEKMGNTKDAIKFYETSLSEDPAMEEAATALKRIKQ